MKVTPQSCPRKGQGAGGFAPLHPWLPLVPGAGGNLLVISRSPGCRQNRVRDLPRVTNVITQNSSLGLSGRSPSDVTAAHRPYCVLCPHYAGTNAFPIGGYATGNPSRARRSQATPLSAIPESPCVSQDAICGLSPQSPFSSRICPTQGTRMG